VISNCSCYENSSAIMSLRSLTAKPTTNSFGFHMAAGTAPDDGFDSANRLLDLQKGGYIGRWLRLRIPAILTMLSQTNLGSGFKEW
jgi:hypothetical protein